MYSGNPGISILVHHIFTDECAHVEAALFLGQEREWAELGKSHKRFSKVDRWADFFAASDDRRIQT
jgi:hypothetical protein